MLIKLQKIRIEYFYPLIFFPIYISTTGIYKSEVSSTGLHLGETGLIFPASFYIGGVLIFILLFNCLKRGSISKHIFSNFIIKQSLFVFVFVFFLTLVGVIMVGSLEPFLRGGQILTGAMGIVISVYLFSYKKLNPEKAFGKIAIFYVFIICLNYISSYMSVGIVSFGPSLEPSIFGIGIYQSRVYFPYIVSLICFMGLPYIYKKVNYLVVPYLLIFGFYIFCLQVRGALLSFIVLFLIAVAYFVSMKLKIVISVLILLIIISLKETIFNSEMLGRFAQLEKIEDFNGRTAIWNTIIMDIDIKTLIFGNFFIDRDGITAHNQYLQNLDLGGLFLIIPLLTILITTAYITLKSILLKRKDLAFISFVVLVNLIIDCNVNVPLSNTNPSIHYWFYWSGYAYYVATYYKQKRV